MRLSSNIIVLLAFVTGAALCGVAAVFAVSAVEDGTEIGVRRALDMQRHTWAEVEADGLRVILSGTAPDEATRFHALSTAGEVVDAARIIDEMAVTKTADLAAPRFSAEILRNDAGISIIGLIPGASDRAALIESLRRIDADGAVTELIETADYPVPQGWEDAMGFAVIALSRLPRSKISVDAGRVEITAISDSAEARDKLEAELTRAAPPGLRLAVEIAAPRPVITPFTLRFILDAAGARFDACAADTEAARERILAAAAAAGLTGEAGCTIGLGVPSPHWGAAAETSIAALAELGGGIVTLSDADVTLLAAEGTDPALFDRVAGELGSALPDLFALHAVLPEPAAEAEGGPPEFTATRSPEGLVQLRGRLSDEYLQHMADSYAKARFGSQSVHTATRIVPDLPEDWSLRVLAGLEALSRLSYGAVTVTPDGLSLRGTTAREETSAEVARLLSDKLGEGAAYSLDLTYRAPPKPADTVPTPEECEARLAMVQQGGKITFEPGSATIAEESLPVMEKIAEILSACGDLRLEIQGHTDSQGREVMNQQLSQSRAQSVLNELRARRVLTATYTAVGYGESQPIADNRTEEGREENRRIEFRLIRPKPIAEEQKTLEELVEELPAPEEAEDGEIIVTDPDAGSGDGDEDAPIPRGDDNEQN